MSNSIHSTVNASSSTTPAPGTVSPSLPSVFELLAQERLSELLRPCLRQIIKYLHDSFSALKIFKYLEKYKEELVLLIDAILQWLYLNSHNALIGERFYGLKRSAETRIRTLILTVFFPYVKVKLNTICEEATYDPGRHHRFFFTVAKMMPKIETFFEAVCWFYRISYAFGKTEYYSPLLQLAGVKLMYTNPQPVDASPASGFGKLFSGLNKALSAGLFLIQFADWLKTTGGTKTKSLTGSSSIPKPNTLNPSKSRPKKLCGLCKNVCNVPTAITGSGYVYCNQCITEYIEKYQRDPKTNQPITADKLVQLYSS